MANLKFAWNDSFFLKKTSSFVEVALRSVMFVGTRPPNLAIEADRYERMARPTKSCRAWGNKGKSFVFDELYRSFPSKLGPQEPGH